MAIFAKPSELNHLAEWLVRKRRGEIIRVFSGAERLEFESCPLRRKVHKNIHYDTIRPLFFSSDTTSTAS